MVDEVQDFSPLELAVLLDTHQRAALGHAGRRHRAGHRPRARLLRTGPSCSTILWTSRTSGSSRCASATARRARSSTPPSTCSGRCMGDVRPVAPRAGAPVESFGFASAGECARVPVARAQGAGARRARGLGGAAGPPPRAGAALLRGAGRAPRSRRCAWSPTRTSRSRAGIDVTDVRQTKGLEFDIVILLEVNEASYPVGDDARRLLHVAMTRAAHQLWVTYTGARLTPAARRRCA